MTKSNTHLEQLAKLQEQKKKMESEYLSQVRHLLHGAIEEKEREVNEARERVREAQKEFDHLEEELDNLRLEAGMTPRRPGKRGGRRISNKPRKARVDIDTKKEKVADLLKNHPRGVDFSQLKAALLDYRLPDSTSPVFATADFNSSMKFGEKYLPEGWAVVGERRNAKVQRT